MTMMTTRTAPTTAQKTMLRRWSVVCALFGVTLEEGFAAMRWVKSIQGQNIRIGCGCGCGGLEIGEAIVHTQSLLVQWDLGKAMDNCRTH